ncbi:MAG: LysR family transcriptional regulator [Neomegalonema sp.]|nr:LysR family transcriptional regulator [Neomegalonema sp.]
MNWDDGRLLLAVARAGQMLGAARALGLNQATLSRRLAALEARLQTKLLERGPSGCSLTSEGAALLAHLERAESAFIEGEALFEQGAAHVAGTVRIGAPDGLGVHFLAPRLHKLMARHPGLRLQLVPVPRSFSLSQREADIAVMIGRPDRGRLVVRKLTDYSLGLYASRDYLEAHGTPQSLDDLARHRLIGYVEDLIFTPELAYTAEILERWPAQLEIASAIGQFEAVRAGAGVGILHDFIAAGTRDLVRLFAQTSIHRAYWTAYHEDLRAIRRVQIVSQFLNDEVSSHPGWVV